MGCIIIVTIICVKSKTKVYRGVHKNCFQWSIITLRYLRVFLFVCPSAASCCFSSSFDPLYLRSVWWLRPASAHLYPHRIVEYGDHFLLQTCWLISGTDITQITPSYNYMEIQLLEDICIYIDGNKVIISTFVNELKFKKTICL